VHRDDVALRLELLDDLGGVEAVERVHAADRDEQDVDAVGAADAADLGLGQHVAEVAEVDDAQAVGLDDEDAVLAALGAALVVVVGADGVEMDVLAAGLLERLLEGIELLRLAPLAADLLEAVEDFLAFAQALGVADDAELRVVGVEVAHQDEVGVDRFWVKLLDGVRVGDDADAVGGHDLEHRLAVPADAQAFVGGGGDGCQRQGDGQGHTITQHGELRVGAQVDLTRSDERRARGSPHEVVRWLGG